MNQEAVNRDLAENDQTSSPFQKHIVELCMKYMRISSERMSRFHDGWDNNDFIYRGYRIMDKDDKDAVKDNEPPKIIVPITFAQVQTAVSFLISMYTQRDVLYQLNGRGPEDEKHCGALEADLDYQLTKQRYLVKLYCFLLDTFKYGFGVQKISWVTEYERLRVGKKVESFSMIGNISKLFGGNPTPEISYQESVEEVLSYEGNKIINVAPFSFYPDPSVTLARFQEGKFVAHDEETSRVAVTKLEGNLYFGTGKIPHNIPPEDMKMRRRRTGRMFAETGMSVGALVPGTNEGKDRVDCVVLSEIQFEAVPAELSERTGFDLGKEKVPIKFVAVLGNDKKLIRFEPLGYLHDKYTFALAEYSPDNSAFYNPGLSDTIYELQNMITFFLNSHMVNVRKIIQNRFIGDDTKINMEDVKSNAPFIRLKQSGMPLDRIYKQLEVMDVTKQHVSDMDTLIKLVQVVTGINENALGQYAGGRRSATEARSVNAGAAARLKLHGQLIWTQGLEPMGQQLLANTRQGRTREVYSRIVGDMARLSPFEQTILADPKQIAGAYDFMPFDGTLPSDRQFQAGVFQELLTGLLQNPQAAQILDMDPKKVIEHIAELYGIRNMEDFRFDQQGNPTLPPGPQAQVMPDAQVQQMIQNGGMAPVDMTGEGILRSLANG